MARGRFVELKGKVGVRSDEDKTIKRHLDLLECMSHCNLFYPTARNQFDQLGCDLVQRQDKINIACFDGSFRHAEIL